jgi:hypothetical protein
MTPTAVAGGLRPVHACPRDAASPPPLRFTKGWPRLVLGLVVATAVGCTKSGGSSIIPLHATIGSSGGTLRVGTGEVALTIPAGVLQHDTMFSLQVGETSPVPGWLAVSTPYTFMPTATTFSMPVQITLRYFPTRVSSAVATSEIRVAWRNTAGQVSTLVPTFANATQKTVICNADALGTFWVQVPDVVAAAELFPLYDTDVYHYDTGMVVTVARSTTEPNIGPTEVAKVTFELNGNTWGTYFDVTQSKLAMRGSFVDPGWQEVFATSVLLVDARDGVGTVHQGVGTYAGYLPLGSTTVGYQGLAEVTTELADRGHITAPLGTFNTLHVPITTHFNNSWPSQGDERVEFWFAAGIGPVAIRLPGNPITALLVTATVNGNPVAGS